MTLIIMERDLDLAQLSHKQQKGILELTKLLIDNLTISLSLSWITLIMQVQCDSRQLKRESRIFPLLPDGGYHAHPRIALTMHKVE